MGIGGGVAGGPALAREEGPPPNLIPTPPIALSSRNSDTCVGYMAGDGSQPATIGAPATGTSLPGERPRAAERRTMHYRANPFPESDTLPKPSTRRFSCANIQGLAVYPAAIVPTYSSYTEPIE